MDAEQQQEQQRQQEPSSAAAVADGAAPPAKPHPAPGPVAQPTKRGGGRKGGRGRGGAAAAAAAAAEQDPLLRLGPEVARGSERLRTGWRLVRLCEEDKAAEVELGEGHLTARSTAGYRMARATHGAHSGTWYFEVKVEHLGPTGAARIGWATRQAELNAPVGADAEGYSYRSKEGSKVHKGWRDAYGQAFGEGDVVGCLLHLPQGGRPFEKGVSDVVRYRGKLYFSEGAEARPPEPQPLPGSCVAFSLNGVPQGKAYEGVHEGTYYPALSLYTHRGEQGDEAAVATVNFGEQGFAFPPPQLEGLPPPRPACEMSGPRPMPPPPLPAAAAVQGQPPQQQEQAVDAAQPGPAAEQPQEPQEQQQGKEPEGAPAAAAGGAQGGADAAQAMDTT